MLRGVRFRTRLGVSRSEREIPQDVTVDVSLELPSEALPARDSVRDVVDYDKVVSLVVEQAATARHRLLETYARQLLEVLLEATPATGVRVAVSKLRAPTSHSVDAITVELSAQRAAPPAPSPKR